MLLAMQVYPPSDCGKELGLYGGYLVSATDGTILRRSQSERQLKSIWPVGCPSDIYPTGFWGSDDLKKAQEDATWRHPVRRTASPPEPLRSAEGGQDPYGQPPAGQQPAYGQQQPAYGQPAYGQQPAYGPATASRGAAPRQAAGHRHRRGVVTIIMSLLSALVFGGFLIALLVSRDSVIDEFETQPGFEDVSADDIFAVFAVILAVFAVWCLIATLLGVLVMRRSNAARILLVISSAR